MEIKCKNNSYVITSNQKHYGNKHLQWVAQTYEWFAGMYKMSQRIVIEVKSLFNEILN